MTRGSFPARAASLKEGSARYQVSVDTLRRRISSGELTAYRLGKQIIRIDLDEADALFAPIPTVGSDVA